MINDCPATGTPAVDRDLAGRDGRMFQLAAYVTGVGALSRQGSVRSRWSREARPRLAGGTGQLICWDVGMSIFVRARFDVLDQRQADFEQVALALCKQAAEEPGTRSFRWF